MSSVRAVVKVLKHIPRQVRVLYLAQTTPLHKPHIPKGFQINLKHSHDRFWRVTVAVQYTILSKIRRKDLWNTHLTLFVFLRNGR